MEAVKGDDEHGASFQEQPHAYTHPRHHALPAALAHCLPAFPPRPSRSWRTATTRCPPKAIPPPLSRCCRATRRDMPSTQSTAAAFFRQGRSISTEGRGAHAHAEGTGSLISLQGASVSTTGISAAGASLPQAPTGGRRCSDRDTRQRRRGTGAGRGCRAENVQVRSTGGDALRLMGGTLRFRALSCR